MIEGEGSNGKSVYCAVINAMLGDEAVAHVPLEIFGQRFALTATLDRLVNIAADCGEIDKVAEGHLKAFTSGDRMYFDRKGVPGVFAVPTARMMLACNNLPRLSDRSSGIWRRIIVVPFNATIPESRRVIGMDKPPYWRKSGELPGIFNWAMEGLKRLHKRGHFTVPKICRDAVEDYKTEVNPTRAFLSERIAEIEIGQIPCTDVYKLYRDWCGDNGHRPLSEGHFGKEIHRAFPKVEIIRPREGNLRVRYYVGLQILGNF